MRTSRHPALRFALFWTGALLIAVTPLVGAIPGPGGVFVFAAGLALMLQNSHWAKRRFVHTKRRWPRLGHYADIGLRRASARRRRERNKIQSADAALEQVVQFPTEASPWNVALWLSFVSRRIKTRRRAPPVEKAQER